MYKKAHFVGIGGAGMSGLARFLKESGAAVSGSDAKGGAAVDALRSIGIESAKGHMAENVPADSEIVIRSAAVPDNSPEIVEAGKRGIPVKKYAEVLGEISRGFDTIAVSGTHGKTTTCAMICYLLERCGMNPSFICGGEIIDLNCSSKFNKDAKIFVTEACEFDRSFLNLAPKSAVICNVEPDHLDYYGSIENIENAFREFASLVPADGAVFYNVDSPGAAKVIQGFEKPAESLSLKHQGDWTANIVEANPEGTAFTVSRYGKQFGEFKIKLTGLHNVQNALAAIAVATRYNAGKEFVQVALAEFTGARRRMDMRGYCGGSAVIDDYAHHPAHISAVISGMRQRFPDKKVWIVFQPHQASRTRAFLDQFSNALCEADIILVTEVYRAREEMKGDTFSARSLYELIYQSGKPCLFFEDKKDAIDFTRKKVNEQYAVAVLGAGDIGDLVQRLVS